jgi:hypothetical protein
MPAVAASDRSGGWLHETARNFAITTVRSEERCHRREQEAVTMGHLDASQHDDAWDQIAPHLDSALRELSEPDRDAILLRFFERKTAREIGECLRISEEAAQKRADLALERLRAIFASRERLFRCGLASLISVQTVQSAPPDWLRQSSRRQEPPACRACDFSLGLLMA